MPPRHVRFRSRTALLAGAALAAMVLGAAAKDLPGTPEGASKISSVIETYVGKAAATPPALVVTPEVSGYLIAIDIGALTATLPGVVYDPAIIKLMAFEQDDGTWRLEQTELPPLSGHSIHGDARSDFSVAVKGYKNATVIDPVLSWVLSSQSTADKLSFTASGPGVKEAFEVGPAEAALTSKAAPEGAVSTTFKESLGAFSLALTVNPKAIKPDTNPDAKPFDVSAKSDATNIDVNLDGLRTRAMLDLWAFWIAHPTRPDLAANEAAFKSLLTAALAGHPSFAEDVDVKRLVVRAPKGPFAFDEVKVGAAGAFAGPDSRFDERFAASGLTLPPGLVPEAFHDLVPTSFDIGFKVGGINLTAAAVEAVVDMHLAGDQPPISQEDEDKVIGKLVGNGPVVIDIAPSRIQAPELDLAFEGQLRYVVGKPTGTITVHMHDFDKTATALKGLDADTQTNMVPLIAMAKGLANTDGDGGLSWVGEVGADGMMKVNGLPLGKAPFASGAK